jgi:hypothetical protein
MRWAAADGTAFEDRVAMCWQDYESQFSTFYTGPHSTACSRIRPFIAAAYEDHSSCIALHLRLSKAGEKYPQKYYHCLPFRLQEFGERGSLQKDRFSRGVANRASHGHSPARC